MKIIMSPAKKMRSDEDASITPTTPYFLEESHILEEKLKSMSYEDLRKLWKTNESLTHKCFEELEKRQYQTPTCAIYAYDGIAFKYLHPFSMSDEERSYLNNHLRILSGMYGVLTPTDGIVPYRLEMGVKSLNLYEYWGSKIYESLDDHVIINLASKEYSKCITDYLTGEDQCIEIQFLRNIQGVLKQQATYAKMARGAMISYMAKEKVENIEDLKKFNDLDFVFDEKLSNDYCFVFVQGRNENE